uniref:Integrase core domain containing protein n=1 Tax=Solanum tuberosum TaxID=4113 RepID=M1DZD8_SOLTU
MDRKIQLVNKCFDAFELRVLEQPDSTIDLSFFQSNLTSLGADVDAIIATSAVEPQAAPTALADDTVLDALFSGTAEDGPEPTHTKGMRHRSGRTEEEKDQKRKRRQEKEARKASILHEELRQQRMRESIAGASSSAPVVEVPPVMRDVMSTNDGAVRVTESTTEGAMILDVGTIEGDPSMVLAGSRKSDPPACKMILRRNTPQVGDEMIQEMWLKLQAVLQPCSSHWMTDKGLLECFYRGLGPENRGITDELCKGGMLHQPYEVIAKFFDGMVEAKKK